ncbi:hypothetical protein [Nocardioides sp. AE5]|uniref:hypothetical protein n=1 Tax=Nocardioides sp. AE5 TaxID=2962573 RepID=UPI002881432E|nr:hypothetical protein [Nocardioides sp. AE5]MDT0202235.1 hypothetical protein [Nocardioides sp. AE5]
MAADPDPGAGAHDRRVERWTRDSAELRGDTAAVSPEEAALRRYQRSRTSRVSLPHPALAHHRAPAWDRRRTVLGARLAISLALVAPLLVVLGVVVGPLAAKIVLWALLVPTLGLAAHDARALVAGQREHRLVLRGGLADAWSDWVGATGRLEELDGAAQARAAVAVNEDRMRTLVQSLARAEAQPGHQDTPEQATARTWVYRTSAKAVALVAAERELEASARRELMAGEIELAPNGDLDALDLALGTARELTSGADDQPQ